MEARTEKGVLTVTVPKLPAEEAGPDCLLIVYQCSRANGIECKAKEQPKEEDAAGVCG